MKKLIGGLVMGGVVASASAQDPAAWGKYTKEAYGACSFVSASAAIMGNVTPADIERRGQCVSDKLAQARTGYQALRTSPAASAALKDYYAAWTAAMQSLPRLLTQPRAVAAGADAANSQRLNELWARFEIEAGG